ncbi:MAG: glycogen synthase GlgA [Bryobacteraceae bacterium]
MKILMIASEAIPYAKTGGLGDVVGALPAALRSLGHQAAVFLPRYAGISLKDARRVFDSLPIWLGPARYDTSVWRAAGDIPFYFLDHPALFEREGFYGRNGEDYRDNHIRFAVFARAALAVARYLFRPDILHCHDWQAGLVPAYLRTTFANDPTFLGAPVLFTIHNLGYQGLFPREALAEIALDPSSFVPEGLEYYGQVSFIKGGLNYSDWLNAVSPAYAREIQTPEYGFGMDGVLRARSGVLSGILNGVDYREWNPETDPYIAANYSVNNLAGKRECKRALLRDFGLPEEAMERPLLGVVSRLTVQKGAGLIAEIAGQLAAEGFYLAGLGAGDPECEDLFRGMASAYPENIAVRLGYDNALAHRVEAGADMFLMPSLYEPCGLNQMYSLRYGTVPVVRATGGLDDTIKESTGFKFREYSGQALLEAVRAAGAAYADPPRWRTLVENGMREDFSWEASAARYVALYRRLSGGV